MRFEEDRWDNHSSCWTVFGGMERLAVRLGTLSPERRTREKHSPMVHDWRPRPCLGELQAGRC
jgi:hypothetical protein